MCWPRGLTHVRAYLDLFALPLFVTFTFRNPNYLTEVTALNLPSLMPTQLVLYILRQKGHC